MRKIKFRAFHHLTKEIIDSDEVENSGNSKKYFL